MEFAPLRSWLPYDEHPPVIAGPCSAESERQVMETARLIAAIPQVKVFRSGIWKPRTRPGGFEGVGREGLKWLRKVKEETGLLTTVEVARPEHVVQAVDEGIDILWIGARTVVNPFSVQELSEALSGIDIPLMVKNPVSPDVKLWMGAIERFVKTGHNKIAGIHRGFSQMDKTIYRYPPLWDIPIELMRQMPGLPVLCDPSHIAGNTTLIQSVSQQALDLEMCGLMIETHYDPRHALTDAKQQVTPALLQEILDNLVCRASSGNREFERSLEELRNDIDSIDDQMLHLLAKRMDIAAEMGKYKYAHNITILQLRRWKELYENRMVTGQQRGLNGSFLSTLLRVVHDESIRIQTDIMGNASDVNTQNDANAPTDADTHTDNRQAGND